MTVAEIEPNQLAQLAADGQAVQLIDVRSAAEFQSVHAESATNVPLDQLDPQAVMAARSADDPLYVICQMGGRSRKACQQFIDAGFTNVVNVAGGTARWESQGLPVVKSPPQAKFPMGIAAAALIAIGLVLASMLTTAPWVGVTVSMVGAAVWVYHVIQGGGGC